MATEKKSLGLFEAVYIVMLAALLVLAVFFMGKPRVGVIDMAQVARELGVEERIANAIQEQREEAGSTLQGLRQEYAALGEGLKSRVAELETNEAKEELRRTWQEATQEFRAQRAGIQRDLQREQQAMLITFRRRIAPFVNEISRKRRLWVVIDRSARLVYAAGEIDITEDVVKKARAAFEAQESLIDEDLLEQMAETNMPPADIPEPEPEDLPPLAE